MKIMLPAAVLIAAGTLSFQADTVLAFQADRVLAQSFQSFEIAQPSSLDAQSRKLAQTDTDKPATPAAPPAASADGQALVAAGEAKKPLDVVKSTELRTLKNPYTDNVEAIAQGKKLYFAYSCNGCHGGGGGGGMCPPLTNDTWVYGSDDDILFRVIALGSQDLMKDYGLKRKGQETVVGPMPPFGELIKSDQELWKIIAFIRTVFRGSKKNW